MRKKLSKSIIQIGRLGDAYGVKGWSHLVSFTQPANNIFQYTQWLVREYKKRDAQWKPVVVEMYKPHGAAFVVKIKGCEDRDQSLLLKNQSIAIERADLPTLASNQFYWHDLIGLVVITRTGASLGVIDYLFETLAYDMIATKGEKTHYIPYTQKVVKSVDLEKKIMTVEWEPLG